MGISGNDVAKDAAAVIFMDDNFANIVLGIREGRLLFDNLKKTCAYTLTHLYPEAIPILLNLTFGFPLALNGLLILSIDLITETPPAISFAYEEPEHGILERPPRNSLTDRLVDNRILVYSYFVAGLVESGACVMAYFLEFQKFGFSASQLYNSSNTYFKDGAPNIVAELNGKVYTASE